MVTAQADKSVRSISAGCHWNLVLIIIIYFLTLIADCFSIKIMFFWSESIKFYISDTKFWFALTMISTSMEDEWCVSDRGSAGDSHTWHVSSLAMVTCHAPCHETPGDVMLLPLLFLGSSSHSWNVLEPAQWDMCPQESTPRSTSKKILKKKLFKTSQILLSPYSCITLFF